MTLTGYDPKGRALSYSIFSPPAHGVLSGAAPNLTYTPKAGFTGKDRFTFKVNNGYAKSLDATVSIVVTKAAMHVPVFASDTLAYPDAAANRPYGGTLATMASDVDGGTLTFSKAAGPNWLEVAADGTLSGTPPGHKAGTNRWTVVVTDSTGLASTTVLEIKVAEGVVTPSTHSPVDPNN